MILNVPAQLQISSSWKQSKSTSQARGKFSTALSWTNTKGSVVAESHAWSRSKRI